MSKKKMIPDFYKMKQTGEKITFLTAYDYPTATFAEEAAWVAPHTDSLSKSENVLYGRHCRLFQRCLTFIVWW